AAGGPPASGPADRHPEARHGAHPRPPRVPDPGYGGPAPPGDRPPEPDAAARGARGAHPGTPPGPRPLPRPEAERRRSHRGPRDHRDRGTRPRATGPGPHRALRTDDPRARLDTRPRPLARWGP